MQQKISYLRCLAAPDCDMGMRGGGGGQKKKTWVGEGHFSVARERETRHGKRGVFSRTVVTNSNLNIINWIISESYLSRTESSTNSLLETKCIINDLSSKYYKFVGSRVRGRDIGCTGSERYDQELFSEYHELYHQRTPFYEVYLQQTPF